MYYNLRSRVHPQSLLSVDANHLLITITNYYSILIQMENKHKVKTLTLPGYTTKNTIKTKKFIF